MTLAWNVPVHEQSKHPEAASYRTIFDKMLEQAPPEIARILSAMRDSRLTTYGDDPRLGFAEVADDGHGGAKIVATGTPPA